MKRLFRIRVEASAPKLKIDPTAPYAAEFEIFDGSRKAQISPKSSFPIIDEPRYPWQQVLGIAPGAFVLSEEAWEKCEDMYYVLESGNELLAAKNATSYYRIINPLDFAPPSDDPIFPFNLNSFNAPVFRLKNRNPAELFCLSGSETPGNEFKYTYENFGFTGLSFEEVWREK